MRARLIDPVRAPLVAAVVHVPAKNERAVAEGAVAIALVDEGQQVMIAQRHLPELCKVPLANVPGLALDLLEHEERLRHQHHALILLGRNIFSPGKEKVVRPSSPLQHVERCAADPGGDPAE